MSKNNPAISIVIATFNGEKTLPAVLESIKKQTFPQKRIEILIIDGGSSDSTLEIAKKHRCKIVHNQGIEPVGGKILGYKEAKGDYLIFIDQDEVVKNVNSIKNKYIIFKNNSKVKAVIGSGYSNPRNSNFITSYINEYGDPFTYFLYRNSKNEKYFIQELRGMFKVLCEDDVSVIFDFTKDGFLFYELGAANSMIDLKYTKEKYPHYNVDVFSHLLQHFISNGDFVAVSKNDPVVHYSSTSLVNYSNKIRWRVKNNIYHTTGIGVSGYLGREKYHPLYLKTKKYLFLPYAYSFIFPIVDSVFLACNRKDIGYLLHFPLTLFTAFIINYHILLKLLGYKPQLRNYDQSRIIKQYNRYEQ